MRMGVQLNLVRAQRLAQVGQFGRVDPLPQEAEQASVGVGNMAIRDVQEFGDQVRDVRRVDLASLHQHDQFLNGVVIITELVGEDFSLVTVLAKDRYEQLFFGRHMPRTACAAAP